MAALEQALDRRLYGAVCKGVSGVTDYSMTVVFEKDGETLELRVRADGDSETTGLDAIIVTRQLGL